MVVRKEPFKNTGGKNLRVALRRKKSVLTTGMGVWFRALWVLTADHVRQKQGDTLGSTIHLQLQFLQRFTCTPTIISLNTFELSLVIQRVQEV